MEKEQLRQELIDTLKKLETLDKEWSEKYPYEEIGYDGYSGHYNINHYDTISSIDEVNLYLTSSSGLAFSFSIDVDDCEDLISSLRNSYEIVKDGDFDDE